MKKEKVQLNWPLVGNSHIVDYLAKILSFEKISGEDNSLTGSYIFCGPRDLGKSTIASYFAKSLMCQQRGKEGASLPCGICPTCQHFQAGKSMDSAGASFESVHSDLFFVKREEDKKNISIEQIRQFIRDLHMSSFMNSYKVGVIKEADTMSEEAANALLKTLEEPKNRVVIILLAENIEAMPATIASRSQILNFRPVDVDVIYNYLIKEHKVTRGVAKNVSRLSLGRPALAVKFLQEKDFYSNYLHLANIFLRFPGQDMNVRLDIIEEQIGSRSSGQEAVKTATAMLEAWQSIARDMILFANGQLDLVQHIAIDKDVESMSRRYTVSELLSLIDRFDLARRHLSANVNPRHVLENLVLSV